MLRRDKDHKRKKKRGARGGTVKDKSSRRFVAICRAVPPACHDSKLAGTAMSRINGREGGGRKSSLVS